MDINDITFTNNYMFACVMMNPELCAGLLKIILGITVSHLEYHYENEDGEDIIIDNCSNLTTEKYFKDMITDRAIRLDAYYEEDTRVFNVEMQVDNSKTLPRRTRTYHGKIVTNSFKMGQDFGELKDAYVIFLCMFDFPGYDEPIYTLKTKCIEHPEYDWDDGATTILVNGSYNIKNDEFSPLINLIRYMQTKEVSDEYTQRINNTVEEIKNNEKIGGYIMTVALDREIAKNEARAAGREEGIVIGMEKGLAQGIEKGLAQGLAQGVEEGREDMLADLIKGGYITEETAQKFR